MPLNILRERFKRTFRTFGSENPNGLDIAFCVIDTKTNIMQYAGAYNPLWIIRSDEFIEYKATRNPIGFYIKEKDFQNYKIQLQDDDLIYLFSDGYKDQIGGENKRKFTNNRFKNLLIKIHHLPLNEQKTELAQTLQEWKQNYNQIDDITVMGVKWKNVLPT